MNDIFKWGSLLGISVALFMVIGFLWLIIGTLTVPLIHRNIGSQYIFVSKSTDEAYYAISMSELLVPGSALYKFRILILTVLSGFLVLAGMLFILIAWFGLRQSQAWALVALAVAGGIAIALWALALSPYFRLGIRITIGDIPPFMWIPAVLIIPATILGWLGLTSG